MTDMNMVPAEDREITEEEFLASYSMKDFPSVAVTVDLLIFTIRDGSLSLLLIKRGGHPEKASGLFLVGSSTPLRALMRRLLVSCSRRPVSMLVGTWSS